MIDIKDISGNIRFSTPINQGSKRKFLLMKEDYITLKFSLDKLIPFSLGDNVDHEIGMFELVDLYKPDYNIETGAYEYNLRLDAYYWKWKNKKFFFTPENGGREASWNLTDSLKVHMQVFLKNLEVLGYKYQGEAFECIIDDSVNTSSKLISYDSANLIDALSQMAEAFECEWWVVKNEIHFGRCENGDPVDFELGMNVGKMDRSDSQSMYATRIYAFGSTRNIPPTYRKKLIFDIKQVSGRDIADTSRVLDIKFFPENAIVEAPEVKVLFNHSSGQGYYTSSPATYSKDWIIAESIKAGKYNLIPKTLSVGGVKGAAGSLLGKYKATLNLSYSTGGKNQSILLQSKEDSSAGLNRYNAIFTECSFEFKEDVSNCKLSVYTSVDFFGDEMNVGFDTHCDIVIQCVSKAANIPVIFLSGVNKGREVNAIYNPDFLPGDAANVLRLPEGITASIGDKYTIDNIVKSKVPVSYFSDDKDTQIAEGIAIRHLLMPEGVTYIDAYPDMKAEEAVEQIVVFDDIYPKREGVTDMVTTHTYTDTIDNPDGTKTSKDWLAWRFKDAEPGFHFSKDYKLDSEELRIEFLSGPLAGMDFEVLFNPYDKVRDDAPKPEHLKDGTWNRDAQVYEIKRNDNYGRMLPDDILHPTDQGGDTYVLYGYDPQFVSDVMIPNAEVEVEERAKEYIEKLKQDPSTYTNTMMSDYIYGINPETGKQDEGFAKSFTVGQKVKLINKAYFEEARISRIIGFEYSLDIPYDSPVYTVGETAPYSRLGEIESKIDSLTYRKEKDRLSIIAGGGTSSGIEGTNAVFPRNIEVTVDRVGYFKAGDIILGGTTVVDAFIKLISQKSTGELRSEISTNKDVEYGSPKGFITYTAVRNSQGPMEQAYYDGNPNNKLNFSEEVGGVQTATRQLDGFYTQKETYIANVIYAASEDDVLPRKVLSDSINVNVHRKWFAGVCSSMPKTSDDVRALGSNDLYSGPGTYQFPVSNWKIVVVCVPSDSVCDISIASSYGNFIENGKVCSGPKAISVAGANGKDEINYKMWVIQTPGLNDPDSFTFKTV